MGSAWARRRVQPPKPLCAAACSKSEGVSPSPFPHHKGSRLLTSAPCPGLVLLHEVMLPHAATELLGSNRPSPISIYLSRALQRNTRVRSLPSGSDVHSPLVSRCELAAGEQTSARELRRLRYGGNYCGRRWALAVMPPVMGSVGQVRTLCLCFGGLQEAVNQTRVPVSNLTPCPDLRLALLKVLSTKCRIKN